MPTLPGRASCAGAGRRFARVSSVSNEPRIRRVRPQPALRCERWPPGQPKMTAIIAPVVAAPDVTVGLEPVHGPLPADTAFTPAAGHSDAILAMYHDQGLPVVEVRRLRPCGKRNTGSADRTHLGRPRYGLRHCRPGAKPIAGSLHRSRRVGDAHGVATELVPPRSGKRQCPDIERANDSVSTFLTDPGVPSMPSCARCNATADDIVVEIGPGARRAITDATRGDAAVSCMPSNSIAIWPRNCGLATAITTTRWSRFMRRDALRFDFAHPRRPQLRVVGNLPYNISTPLAVSPARLSVRRYVDMHFMLQKEVVDRMAATPGSKAYGRLGDHARLSPADATHCSTFDPSKPFEPPPEGKCPPWCDSIRCRPGSI